MPSTIFFSWQSDTPNSVGRTFIEKALRQALKALASDAEVHEALRGKVELDSDTKNVSGSPRIVDTILEKIDAAEGMLADVTFVARRNCGGGVPNPNVAIEYGWALKSKTEKRVVCVMNEAYGEASPTSLPFDMRHMRFPIRYNLPEGADAQAKAIESAKLAKGFESAFRSILTAPAVLPPPPPEFSPRPRGASPGKWTAQNESLGVRIREQTKVFIGGGPIAWLRVYPKFDPGKIWSMAELTAASQNQNLVSPYRGAKGAQALIRGEDGIGVVTNPVSVNAMALTGTMVFKTGEIWGFETHSLDDDGKLWLDLEDMERSLASYERTLKLLGVPFPWLWEFGYEQTQGRKVSNFPHMILSEIIEISGEWKMDQSVRDIAKLFAAEFFDLIGEVPPAEMR